MLDFPRVSRLHQILVFVVHCTGIIVLKDHTLWHLFMSLPVNSLMQSAWHVTAYVRMMTPTTQITDDTAFKHTGTLHILWLSMKMDVSTALKLISSKMVKPCLTISPWIQEPICSSFKWRSEEAPPNIHFRELPSHILVPTMHTHCCIPAVHGQCWVQFSQITPVQWTNNELFLDVFPKPVPTLVLCSHVLDLPGWKVPSSWWMPTHS